MKSKYKFTSSRHIENGGKLSETWVAVWAEGMQGNIALEIGPLLKSSVAREAEEASLVHWMPRSKQ
jgi:hypothetical protein